MTLCDTHCHLYLDHFREDLPRVLERAVQAGVTRIWLPAIDWRSPGQMDSLRHPAIRFYKMAGLHPCEVKRWDESDEERLYEMLSTPEFVAAGETGLDYYWSRDHIVAQKASLRAHCRVARATDKPVVLHNRESTGDLLDLIESEQDGTLKGVWHCFTGTEDEAKRALDLGLWLGIGGVLTFRNSGLEKVVAALSAGRLLLETDAPYLAPVPKRGMRNEPAYVRYTAIRLAEILQMDPEELAGQTTRNALELFRAD